MDTVWAAVVTTRSVKKKGLITIVCDEAWKTGETYPELGESLGAAKATPVKAARIATTKLNFIMKTKRYRMGWGGLGSEQWRAVIETNLNIKYLDI